MENGFLQTDDLMKSNGRPEGQHRSSSDTFYHMVTTELAYNRYP